MTEELLTVGQVSERFGVTVRTLHHYDAIGLVQPAERGWNGYRLYTAGDVQHLARVVLLRRLELPLDEIAAVLDDDSTLTHVLRRRREAVMERLTELTSVLSAIDTAMKSEEIMSDYAITGEQMKEIFGSGYDEAYDVEAQQRWGHTEKFKESRQRTKDYDADTWRAIKAESDDVMEGFARAKRAGASPSSEEALAAAKAHRDHIERWFFAVPLPMLRGMAQMYSADPRFAARYDEVEPGLAAYVTSALTAYCDGQEV